MSAVIKISSTYRTMAFYSNAPLPDLNARQVAQTIRPPSTSLLTIDSEDRFTDYLQARGDASGNFTSNASPYDFTIQKSESLMNGFLTRCGITEVCFPWAIPNINVKTNKMLYYYTIGAAGPVAQQIDLENAFLRPHEIASAIQAIVEIDVPGFTMEYASDGLGNPSFSYATNDASNTIAFIPMAYNAAGYPYPPQTKQLFDLLGFTNANSAFATSGAGGYTFCQAIRYVDIVCNQLTNNQALKDQTSQTVARDMLCRLYLGDGGGTGQSTVPASNTGVINGTLDASSGALEIFNDLSPQFCPPGCAPMTIYRNFSTPKQIQWIPNQPIPGYLRFQVYDDAGALLSESTGLSFNVQSQYGNLDWSMTLQTSEN